MTLDREPADAAFTADPSHRLTAPVERQARGPAALILAACLVAHALLLAILLFEDFSVASEPTRAEEIPVEIVVELPPEQNALPPPPDLVYPPVVKEKPPPEKVHLDDVEVAHDAPLSGNADQTHKGEVDKETQGPRVAPPPKLAAPQVYESIQLCVIEVNKIKPPVDKVFPWTELKAAFAHLQSGAHFGKIALKIAD